MKAKRHQGYRSQALSDFLDMLYSGESRLGVGELAAELKISRKSIYRWSDVPEEYLPDIVALTGIPASKIRPDLAQLFEGDKARAA